MAPMSFTLHLSTITVRLQVSSNNGCCYCCDPLVVVFVVILLLLLLLWSFCSVCLCVCTRAPPLVYLDLKYSIILSLSICQLNNGSFNFQTSNLPTIETINTYHRNFRYLNVLTILTYYLNQVPAYLGTYACLHILALCELRAVMFWFYPRKTLLHFLPYFIVYLSLYVFMFLSLYLAFFKQFSSSNNWSGSAIKCAKSN